MVYRYLLCLSKPSSRLELKRLVPNIHSLRSRHLLLLTLLARSGPNINNNILSWRETVSCGQFRPRIHHMLARTTPPGSTNLPKTLPCCANLATSAILASLPNQICHINITSCRAVKSAVKHADLKRPGGRRPPTASVSFTFSPKRHGLFIPLDKSRCGFTSPAYLASPRCLNLSFVTTTRFCHTVFC